jgi:hypothetical protein
MQVSDEFKKKVEGIRKLSDLATVTHYKKGDPIAGEGVIEHVIFVQGELMADGTTEGAVVLIFRNGITGASFITFPGAIQPHV